MTVPPLALIPALGVKLIAPQLSAPAMQFPALSARRLTSPVPLLVTEAPFVATGLEERVARDSRAVLVAEESGKVASVTGSQIIVTEDGKLPEGKKRIKHDPANGVNVYQVRKFMRSNAATGINQKILVDETFAPGLQRKQKHMVLSKRL